MSEDLDKIKERLKIDKLDLETRKKLMDQFIKSGGKILSHKELYREAIKKKFSPSSQTDKKALLDKNKLTSQTSTKFYPKEKVYQTQPTKQELTKSYSKSEPELLKPSLLDRLFSHMEAFFRNVVKLFTNDITRTFARDTFIELKRNLENLKLISYLITSKSPEISNIMKAKLESVNEYAYEIIYRLNELYNEEYIAKFDKLREIFENTKQLPLKSIEKELKFFFKKLLIIFGYRSVLKKAVNTSFRDLANYLPKKDLDMIYKNFLSSESFIFDNYFEKLKHAIFALFGKVVSLDNIYFLKYLEISDEDRIGYLTQFKQISKIVEEKKEEAKKEPEQKSRDSSEDILAESLELLKNIRISSLSPKVDPDSILDPNDKALLSGCLIEFIDSQIFPILTMKAKYNVIFEAGKSFDPKKSFDDIYVYLNEIRNKLLDYKKNEEETKKIESEVMNISQKSSLLNARSIEKSRISNEIRKELNSLLGRMKVILDTVLSDYKTERKILSNPDEEIEFNIGNIKKLDIVEKNIFEGRKVIDALQDIYKYILAFSFLLTEGELGGYTLKAEKLYYLCL